MYLYITESLHEMFNDTLNANISVTNIFIANLALTGLLRAAWLICVIRLRSKNRVSISVRVRVSKTSNLETTPRVGSGA